MAKQHAIYDQNKVSGLIAHTGTADTAETQRIVAGVDGGLLITGLHGVVLTTAVAVANGTATALPATILSNRKSMVAYNNGTISIYLGGTGVTGAGNGIPVGTGDFSPAIDLGTSIIYGYGTSAGGTMIVMEVS